MGSSKQVMIEMLRNKEIIFWDFDGVIKESVDCKGAAYERLFLNYGEDISNRVREHHNLNGGMSRNEKFPIYLRWAGLEPSDFLVNDYCQRYSKLVFQDVIDAPVVPGVVNYLEANYNRQYFVLLTGTPHDEIIRILELLQLKNYFREIYGSPTQKSEAIAEIMLRLKKNPSKSLMVGDSEIDYIAAMKNNVPFVLRCNSNNLSMQNLYDGPSFVSLDI